MPCKKEQQETGCGGGCISQGSKDQLRLYCGIPRIQHATSGTFLLYQKHDYHIVKDLFTLKTNYNLVHKFIPMPQAMKIPDATGSVDKEWKKLDTIPSWQLDKVRSKKEVILEAQKVKRKVHFATLMDICHSKTLS